MFPVAMGYLLIGTIGLLATTLVLEEPLVTLSQVVHYYAVGFGALLIFALGARLLIGFYHVSQPRALDWRVRTVVSQDVPVARPVVSPRSSVRRNRDGWLSATRHRRRDSNRPVPRRVLEDRPRCIAGVLAVVVAIPLAFGGVPRRNQSYSTGRSFSAGSSRSPLSATRSSSSPSPAVGFPVQRRVA